MDQLEGYGGAYFCWELCSRQLCDTDIMHHVCDDEMMDYKLDVVVLTLIASC